MTSKTFIAFTVLTLAAGVGFSKDARAFCLFETDCPGGSATVSVEVDTTCKSDADCSYGQQCNTGTGACYTPSSATACACAPDGDPCTDDSGVPSDFGGCFCPHTRLTTPECSVKDGGTPVGILTPINVEPLVPIVPGGKTPADPVTPTDPTPVTPDPEPSPSYGPGPEAPGVCSDPSFTPELHACCESVGGSPLLMMEKCVSDEKRSSDCDIVVNVMGDLGEKAQMNVCCNLLNNAGTIADSTIDQECKNTFGVDAATGTTTPSGEASSKASASETKASSADAGSTSGGCSLVRD